MGRLSRLFTYVGSGSNTGNYYSSMNSALLRLNQEYTMLHYPLYGSENDSFLQAQANLTDFCMSLLPSVSGKELLEVGCGNGVQAIYLHKKYAPDHIRAVDLNEASIAIAVKEAESKGITGVDFAVDDAQFLSTIENNSVDVVISIESAFHYPDKALFLNQIYRVLKPGGAFLIADILAIKRKGNRVKNSWRRKMVLYHWPLERYVKEFPLANFHAVSVSDITQEVIHGFSLYKRWIREMKRLHFLEDLFLRLYYSVHVKVNMYLLRTSRQYYVFVGSKPV